MLDPGVLNVMLTAVGGVVAAVSVFWLVPLIARARVGLVAVQIRGRVMDAVIEGHIDPSDPALDGFIRYTMMLSEHAGSLGITEAALLRRNMVKAGCNPDDFAVDKTYAHMSPEGRRVMHGAEAEMLEATATYLVSGSSAWFILWPLVLAVRTQRRFRRPDQNRESLRLRGPRSLANGIRQEAFVAV